MSSVNSVAPGTSVVALIDEGNALQEQARIAEAMALYDAAVQADPRCATAHLNRGNLLLAGDQIDQKKNPSGGRDCSRSARVHYAALSAILLGAAGYCPAQDRTGNADAHVAEVVIQAKRQAADEQVTRQVQKTLTDDPWIYAEHITVSTENGVVRLEGFVGDTGERFRILRRCRRFPGARRVVDALEIINNDPDGG